MATASNLHVCRLFDLITTATLKLGMRNVVHRDYKLSEKLIMEYILRPIYLINS
jgi:hypothetical protein